MNLKVKILDNYSGKGLEYKTSGSAGFDLTSSVSSFLRPGQRTKIPCGVAFQIPEGYEGNIRPRSGMTVDFGLMAVEGTIDSDYRGEVSAIMVNISGYDQQIVIGQRIAQMVISPVVRCVFEKVDYLEDTDRGTNGFGSTGNF